MTDKSKPLVTKQLEKAPKDGKCECGGKLMEQTKNQYITVLYCTDCNTLFQVETGIKPEEKEKVPTGEAVSTVKEKTGSKKAVK